MILEMPRDRLEGTLEGLMEPMALCVIDPMGMGEHATSE